jgi:hypothetical protein
VIEQVEAQLKLEKDEHGAASGRRRKTKQCSIVSVVVAELRADVTLTQDETTRLRQFECQLVKQLENQFLAMVHSPEQLFVARM